MRAIKYSGTLRSVLWGILLSLMPGIALAQAKTNKIQETVTLLKELYRERSPQQDYITDGERTFWVKYYKTWTPQDLVTLKKENPSALRFLREASAHNRLDVLEQLLPDHYRANGGIQAFSADILR